MEKNPHFSCREPSKTSSQPNFRITQDNPLKLLELYHNTHWRVLQTLGEDSRLALKRMVWSQFLIRWLQVVQWTNYQVLTDHFRESFRKVFQNRTRPIIRKDTGIESLRWKYGTLDTYWPNTDRDLTKHHIVPKSRWGINHDRNYFWIPRDVHDDFHTVFGVMTPVEQLAFLILTFKPIYTPSFVSELSEILLSYGQNHHYRPWILRDNKVEY